MEGDNRTEDPTTEAADARGRRFRSGIVAAGAAFGLTLAGLGVAAGQTDGPSTQPDPGPAVAPAPGPGGPGVRGFRGGPEHHKGPGFGIHGEFTTRAPGGGYQTVATQLGEVTAVSASSLTVKSEDGFSRTYGVDDNTMVNAGNEGIGDVAKGDQVHVMALVADGKASAVDVRDLTRDANLRGHWAPAPMPHTAPGTEPGSTTTTTS